MNAYELADELLRDNTQLTQAEELRNLLEEHGSRSYSVIETELGYE